MRLYAGKVTPIAEEVVRTLVSSRDLESESPKDVVLDVEAVLKNYLQMDRDISDRAKTILERTGKPQTEFARMRQLAADEKGIKIGDEMLDYLLDQLVEMFQHSSSVDEIYAEDVELRRKMAVIFKRHLDVDAALETEIRSKLRHLKEGTREWDIEHAKVAEQVKRQKGLS